MYCLGKISVYLKKAGMGIFFALSTDGELFIYSLMHQCRLSPKFAYGILAAFHLMPNMVREFKNVRIARMLPGRVTVCRRYTGMTGWEVSWWWEALRPV